MHRFGKVFLLLACVTAAIAQTSEPPLSDTRFTIHTLVREDIFAGFLSDNMERFARGEKNIQILLEKRPDAKYELLAWQAGATLYRAVRAHEAKQNDEFQQTYRKALDLFAQAQKYPANNGNAAGGVAAVTGGSYILFADRLPQEYRAAANAQAYDSFQMLWRAQGAAVDRLPVTCAVNCLPGWRNRPNAPDVPKKPISISTACSPCCAIRPTNRLPKNGKPIPSQPPTARWLA